MKNTNDTKSAKAAARRALETAETAYRRALLNIEGAGRTARWASVYYSTRTAASKASAKHWECWVAEAPELAAAVSSYRDAVLTADAAYKAAAASEKARLGILRSERAALAEYRAVHGERPAEKGPNPNAAKNYDVLQVALVARRTAFVEHYTGVLVQAAFAEWRTNRNAAEARARTEARRAHIAAWVFDEDHAKRNARDAAEAEFDSYVAKLAHKIEARITAVTGFTDRGIWTESFLDVATDAGPQRWATYCRHNARYGHNSRNGSLTQYLQWPTERVS